MIGERFLIERMPQDGFPGAFCCGTLEIDEYLTDGTALADERAGFARTYLLLDQSAEKKCAAYFTLLTDSIRLHDEERPAGIRYHSAPALKLARIGVQEEYRDTICRARNEPELNLGRKVLDLAVGLARDLAVTVGVRYLTLDALPEPKLVKWYLDYGFVQTGGESAERARFSTDLVMATDVPMRFDLLLSLPAAQVPSQRSALFIGD